MTNSKNIEELNIFHPDFVKQFENESSQRELSFTRAGVHVSLNALHGALQSITNAAEIIRATVDPSGKYVPFDPNTTQTVDDILTATISCVMYSVSVGSTAALNLCSPTGVSHEQLCSRLLWRSTDEIQAHSPRTFRLKQLHHERTYPDLQPLRLASHRVQLLAEITSNCLNVPSGPIFDRMKHVSNFARTLTLFCDGMTA